MTRPVRFLTGLVCFGILPLFARAAEGPFDFNPRLQLAYHEIQKLRPDKAREILEREKARSPANGFIPYLENYADLFYFLVTDDQKAFTARQGLQEKRLQAISALPDSSPYHRMLLAEIRLHWAFIKLKFGHRLSGCWDIIRADRLLNENKKKFPGFVPHLKALGLLHVMVGAVPEEYAWVARMMGLRGNIREGLAELQRVQHDAPAFGREAYAVALLLKAYILKTDDAIRDQLAALPSAEPDNLLYHFLAASVLMKYGKGEEALRILQQAPSGSDYIPFPFLYYMRGELLLQKGQYAGAYGQYDRFQVYTKGANFVKDSYFKQFLCRWLGNNLPEPALLKRAAATGAQNVEADQHAQRFTAAWLAGQVSEDEKVLFKARYATDGGYLQPALNALEGLDENDFKTNKTKAEFTYRKARILQEMARKKESIPLFRRVLVLSEGRQYYFGAAAALQLGYLYRETGRNDSAAAYFRKAIAYKKHEYKNSIDNKARAALTEMGKNED